MGHQAQSCDVVVVGGGPIGLCCAWRLSQRGLKVTVLDAGERGAWTAAAGMLAPISEAEFGETPRLELALRSAEMYQDFCAELERETGVDPGYRNVGTILVARDEDEAKELERLFDFRRSLGLAVQKLRSSEAREIEPALAPAIRLALSVPTDCSIDPAALMGALRAAVDAAGVKVQTGVRVVGFESSGRRIIGARLQCEEVVRADNFVLAAGAWSGCDEFQALAPGLAIPVRPVKGQSLRLRDPNGPGLITHAVRTPFAYIVPRSDGRYMLGGTVEERGWDMALTAGGLFELVRDQWEVLPGVLELEIEAMCVGVRPGTPDNLPLIGQAGVEGLILATGHYRNGVLLTPITAELVANAICGDPLPEWAEAFSPNRFYNAV